MSTSRVVTWAALAALAGGCGASRSVAHPTVRLPAVRTRSVTFAVPPTGSPRLIAREANGDTMFVAGGARIRVRDGDAVTAMQGFASAIAGGGRIGDRWWFVSADGTVASADDYLDNMRFERALAATVARAFVDHDRLVAVMADGRVSRVDVAPSQPLPRETQPPASPALGDDEVTRIAESALRQFPLSRLMLPSSLVLDSGEVALRGGSTMYFASVESDGTLEPTARIALAPDAGRDCAMHGWGGRVVLTCPPTRPGDESTMITPYVVDHDGADRVGAPSRGPFIIGREGHTLTFARGCPEAPTAGTQASSDAPATPPTTVERSTTGLLGCTLDRDRDWREWEYPSRARLLDVYDASALVFEARDGNTVLRYYDIDMGRGIDVRVDDPVAEIARAGFGPDGRIVVLATAGQGSSRRSLVGAGVPGTPLDLHPLGFYARDIDFADGRFGLAAGETAGDLAETHDGGYTWLRIEDVGLDGTPRALRLFEPEPPRHVSDPPPRIGTDVHCSATICRIGARMVHTWDRSVEIVPPLP